jgi:mono/diheme cytochrome c family protein
MKTWIKWTSGSIALLGVLAMGAAFVGQQMAEHKRQRQISVTVAALAYVSDAPALAWGKYLFESRGCVDCHGIRGLGRSFVDDGRGTHLAGPNITPAGVVARYKPADWVRTLRHGIKPDGRPVLLMPSEDYSRLTDTDLAALVAYTRSLPAARGGIKSAVLELPLPAWVMYGFDVTPDAAQRIDHSLAPAQPVPAGVTAAHGAYVANMCIGCHGASFSGGKIPGGPPDWPASANLTPGEGSAMVRYKDAAQFVAMMRSGKRPDGSAIRVMPFESISKMDDVDLPALYAFLKTLPPQPAGGH